MPPSPPPDTAIVIPAYGQQAALDGLLAALPTHLTIIVVDDGSQPALRVTRGQALRHPVNRGYGAAQRSGYQAALAAGAQRIVMLHGDGQYDWQSTLALADALDQADAAFGSRFLGARPPDLPVWRHGGIRLLASLANLRFGTHFTDLHNGARAYRAATLRALPLHAFADDYHFDHQLVCGLLRGGFRVVERPVAMHYGPDVLSIQPASAVAYGLRCLGDLAQRTTTRSEPPRP